MKLKVYCGISRSNYEYMIINGGALGDVRVKYLVGLKTAQVP
jgi:hypothetical protein